MLTAAACSPLGDLAACVGSDTFSSSLSRHLSGEIAHQQIIVCEYVRSAPVAILMTEGVGDDADMGDIAGKYLSNHFRRASADDSAEEARPVPQVHFAEVSDLELGPRDPASRLVGHTMLCGIGAIVARRAGRSPDKHLVILFVRKGEVGGFRASEKQFLLRNAETIASLIDRHCELSEPPACPLQRWAEHLMAFHGPLSQREALVCAYALMGYSNEATALNLGVSANSAITYRRRAFAKLNIKTQGELFPLLFFPKAATGPRARVAV